MPTFRKVVFPAEYPEGTQLSGRLMGCSPIPYLISALSPTGVYFPPWAQVIMARMLHRKLKPMAEVATTPASGLPMRLPTKTRSAKETSGNTVAMMSNTAVVGIRRIQNSELRIQKLTFQVLSTLHFDRRKVVIEI